MPRSDYRTLINMGRKAGLQTSELYQALSGRRLTPQERNTAGGDGNGFTPHIDAAGHQVYHPLPHDRRS